jgi:hypothetical protein
MEASKVARTTRIVLVENANKLEVNRYYHSIISWLRRSLPYGEFQGRDDHNTVSDTVTKSFSFR